MREIKFRAWDKKLAMWVYPGTNTKGYRMTLVGMHSAQEVMQYTGLKDKNGVEIYEGDIVVVPDETTIPITDFGEGPTESANHLASTESANHLASVVMQDFAFGVDVPKDEYGEGDYVETGRFWSFERLNEEIGLNDFEVIGNIYDNPELLKT